MCIIQTGTAFGFSRKPPVQAPATPAPAQPTPKPPVVQPSPPKEEVKADLKMITDYAASSSCAKFAFRWGEGNDANGNPKTGRMPSSYFKGEALTYARTICNPNREDVVVVGQALGDAKKDGLVYLADKFKAIGAGLSTKEERIRAVHMLLVGSAMRESSGRWYVGKDAGASNDDGETCEAGLHQTSYNSRKAHSVLPKLFALFKVNKDGCFFDVYSKDVTASSAKLAANLKNYGTGEGVKFQELSKYCPGFAVEYGAVMARVQRSHYGPYNTKKVEVVKQCQDMFVGIEKLVKDNPKLCEALK